MAEFAWFSCNHTDLCECEYPAIYDRYGVKFYTPWWAKKPSNVRLV